MTSHREPFTLEQTPPVERFGGRFPVTLRPTPARHEQLVGHRLGPSEQDEGLAGAELVRDSRGHVSITAVLTQAGSQVPQGLHRVVGGDEIPVGREQRPACTRRGGYQRLEHRDQSLGFFLHAGAQPAKRLGG
jgi:hypothetical protein